MRMAIFVGLIFIADRISLLAGEVLDLEEISSLLAFVFFVCIIQDIVSIFKKGAA